MITDKKRPVVAITGSMGKTTTKELISALLQTRYQTLKSFRSSNTNADVKRLFQSRKTTDEAVVVELGVNRKGQMLEMAKISSPDIAVMTGLDNAHLQYFGSMHEIFLEKKQIFSEMNLGGIAIINGADEQLVQEMEHTQVNYLTYGFNTHDTIYAKDIVLDGLLGSSFTAYSPKYLEHPLKMETPIPGKHMILPALCAILVGKILGLSEEEIIRGSDDWKDVPGRCHAYRMGTIKILDDTFNAGPKSLKAALETLSCQSGRKVAVLGELEELGEGYTEIYTEVGKWMADLSIDQTVFIGPKMRSMYLATRQKTSDKNITWFPNKQEFCENIAEYIHQEDTVLLKASHIHNFHSITESINLFC